MTQAGGSRLTVERIDRLSRRPWIFLTGRLEGDPLRVGQPGTIHPGEAGSILATIESIELHSSPGSTTIAIDAAHADDVTVGTVLTFS
jgi:hypothetical protein